MVKYEVPDRFSILTYLSQYYRVFSNQEPTNKKVAEKESKSENLDTKMANSVGFVGVPKREPCRKCGNPVFFAERITFEQKLYHRSCLKCARCGAQLTLGSFYETETDGEYCCETCPDEEIRLSERRRSSLATPSEGGDVAVTSPVKSVGAEPGRNIRSSKLLDRISFFESAPLSDEEKTSVRRAKMNSFLKDSLEPEQGKPDSTATSKQLDDSSESESESEEDDEVPPDPPTSEPPKSEKPPIDFHPKEVQEEAVVSSGPQVEISITENLNMNEDMKDEEKFNVSNSDDIFIPVDVKEEIKKVPDNLETLQIDAELVEKPTEASEQPSIDTSTVEESITHDDMKEQKDIQELLDNYEEMTDKENQPASDVINSLEKLELEVNDNRMELNETEVTVEDKEDESDEKSEEVPELIVPIEKPEEETLKEDVPLAIDKSEHVEDVSLQSSNIEEQETTKTEKDSLVSNKEEYPSDLNPFGDDSDSEKPVSKPVPSTRKISTNPFGSDDEDESQPKANKPPRPPPPKIKTNVPANPFDDDGEGEPDIVPVITKPSPRRTPVPTPRKQHNHNDSISSVETSLLSSQFGGSSISLASSMESGPSSVTASRRKKSKAPEVPSSSTKLSTENLSSNPSTTSRKKRPAPAPPTLSSTPLQQNMKSQSPNASQQRLITLDASLLNSDQEISAPLSKAPSNDSVVYRRTIIPLKVDDDSSLESTNTTAITSERQWEKMKDNKEAQNRNRQSQTSPNSSQPDSYNSFISNKSQQGKWKRRKGPAPALPMPLPERKAIKMLPLKEIRQELDIIETQQQGLEKQGVILEQMIRERCEGGADSESMDITGIQTNSKEVEDLIMQLFELVNEKNELFRRQAELMYLRRQHRLEQEQADLEYEIRLLMAQPERNKTDSDKEKEEALIARLVEIVQMRNEVVDCLEMDRLREAEEDMSIKQSIEERAASQLKSSKKDADTEKPVGGDPATKLSKKEKKKLKEAKKLVKSKKIDSEKDADETESTTKEKKKKKKFFADFLHHNKQSLSRPLGLF
ncbi:MICAL-like protein 1 isoform X2 [Uranotaenia lowii]|nr:MICAL-like protein 1 isoform X2 [Uranotaenia lowii]